MSTKKPARIIVSGIQPSGKLHIGNYVGAVRNWLELQKQGLKPLFFIADYHSITGNYSPAEKRAEILNLATDLLALGIDPRKSTLFVQSDVPEHTELCWIFNTLTPVSFLERMTQFKDKAGNQSQNVNMGLFDYPVLQSADVLLYKGTDVPVGQDQVQHVELTRDIARFFNNKYEVAFFPETKPHLTSIPKLRSITDPLKKMSKSLGEKSYVALTDTPEEILEKMKRAVTESTGMLSMTEAAVDEAISALGGAEGDEKLKGMAGVWNLIGLLRIFGKPGEAERFIASQPMRYGDLKALVATRIAEHFADFRKRRAALAKDPRKVRAILNAGAKKARKIAQANMKEVRKIIGVR
jgi:tryptophanyl-tRNA synthetase